MILFKNKKIKNLVIKLDNISKCVEKGNVVLSPSFTFDELKMIVNHESKLPVKEIGIYPDGSPIGHNGRIFQYKNICVKISQPFIREVINEKYELSASNANSRRAEFGIKFENKEIKNYVNLTEQEVLTSNSLRNEIKLSTLPLSVIGCEGMLIGYIYKYFEGYERFTEMYKESIDVILNNFYTLYINLKELFEHNIYHMDIKGDNVLYKENDVQIIDFDTKPERYFRRDASLIEYVNQSYRETFEMILKKHFEYYNPYNYFEESAETIEEEVNKLNDKDPKYGCMYLDVVKKYYINR